MSLIERGGVWHIDIRRKGHEPVRQTTGIRATGKESRKLAEIKHAEVEKALLFGQEVARGPGPKGPTLRDAFDTALRLHWKGMPCVPTVLDHRTHIFEAIAPTTRLGDIDVAAITRLVALLEARANSTTTINKKLHTLHTALDKAREHHLWDVRPDEVPKMPSFKEPRGRIRVFTADEEAMILAYFARTHVRMVDLVEALVDTGLRLGELLARDKLAHERGGPTRFVHVWDTKGGEHFERRVPLTRRADAALDRWLAQPNLRKNQIEWFWRSMREATGHAGDREFVIHTLRHTCCTRLVLAGMDLRRVQMWMGHRDINTTMRYANVRMDQLAPLAAALEPPVTSPLESIS